MTVSEELTLSCYQTVAAIHAEHGVHLVQDSRDGKFYVRKTLPVYHLAVYRQLLNHPIPNTPRLYAAVEDGNRLITIEEYIPGDTLEELLAHGPLPEKKAVAIAADLCTIAAQLHNQEIPIVHRDIKPANIKITPDGVVKLMDFNAAKPCNSHASRDTVLLGTQGYAAPEQYGFGSSDRCTDIYAIGVLLNEMVTGALPGVRLAGGRLGPIIRRCTQMDPRRRFQQVEQLRRALLGERLPGFRGSNPMGWGFSALGYGVLLYLGATLAVEGASPGALLLNRICFTLAELGVVLLAGNYRGIHSRLPLTRSSHLPVRLLGIVFYSILLFLVMAAIPILFS